MLKKVILLSLGLFLASVMASNAATLQVGPDKQFKTVAEAAKVAQDGDTVEIDVGEYVEDVAVWRQNDLTIRGVGGRAHMEAGEAYAEGKAIWVIKGNNTLVENIEFSGCKVPDKNGAGIRFEGGILTIRNCYFHHNQDGLLTANFANQEVVIENSEFAYNGLGGEGYTHNIYIGSIAKFTMTNSYSHHAEIGHNVKSRAQENYIYYNRIMDEETGNSSYLVDLPNGGESYLIGNLFYQSIYAPNHTLISYGMEGLKNTSTKLYVINNTFVTDRADSTFIRIKQGAEEATILNNLFVGATNIMDGIGAPAFNLVTNTPGFMNTGNFDYRLKAGSPAIDEGLNLDWVGEVNLNPTEQYKHPLGSDPRQIFNGTIDIGAYEYEGLVELNAIKPGDLVKSPSVAAVYYIGNDNKRHAFPNERCYKTWYNDFSQVKTISAEDLAKFPLGSNMTYKPGVRLIKIPSLPTVYAVEEGALLRPIQSESKAVELYGTNWNKMIDDISEAFFTNYRLGMEI